MAGVHAQLKRGIPNATTQIHDARGGRVWSDGVAKGTFLKSIPSYATESMMWVDKGAKDA